MNNKLKMKIISNESIKMKLNDSEPINMNANVSGKEVDPVFTNSPAYTITYNDINIWNHKSNFSGNYNDLYNKPLIPTKTSQLSNDMGYITKTVNNLENYTLTSNLSTVATSGSYDDLLNKPTIPTKTSDLNNDSGFITNSTSDLENYTLTSNLSEVATSGSYSDLLNTPTLANVATTGLYQDLINKPTLSTVASTGDYDDLLDKPTIPTKTSDLNNDSGFITKTVNDLTNYTLTSSLSTVATSGSYSDLLNTPTIPVVDSSVSTSSTNAVENSAITNYVDSKVLTNYSNTETLIGKWVDNNNIYRMVYESTSFSSYIDFNITNLDKIINISGMIKRSDYVIWQQIPSRLDNAGFSVQFANMQYENNVLKVNLSTGSNWSSNFSRIIVIIEYTKSS